MICGSPKTGPWVAWKAMNRVPKAMPATPARMDQPSDRPSAGPTKPIGIVKYWKLPRNQSIDCSHGRPCRSESGIQSIECTSIWPIRPLPLPASPACVSLAVVMLALSRIAPAYAPI